MRAAMILLMLAAGLTAQPGLAQQPEQPSVAVSGSYRITGAKPIRPSVIWDDGAKTFLDWPENIEAPAIFAIDAGGNESLVNSHFRDGRFVIDGVHTRLLFRLDRLVAKAERRVGKS